jgi:hypothetical protein
MHVSQPPLDSKARGGRAVKYDSSLDGEPYCVYGNMSSFIGSSTGMSYCEIPGEEQNRTDGQWG